MLKWTHWLDILILAGPSILFLLLIFIGVSYIWIAEVIRSVRNKRRKNRNDGNDGVSHDT